MKTIPLTQGQVALVDDEDYELLNQHKWSARKDGRTFYAHRSKWTDGKCQTFTMHRVIMNAPVGDEVDHWDGNGLNNQKVNLRLCSHAQNQMNSKVQQKSQTGLKGVTFYKSRHQWRARIGINGKVCFLGYFDCPLEAAAAYNAAALNLHGRFARPNV